MDYELGLRTLKARLPQDKLDEFDVHESKLRDNLDRERLFGGTETTRADRAAILYALNQMAEAHLGISFNDLCQGSAPPARSGRERASLQGQLEEARENLRLVQERKTQYVMETDVPLDLIKQERRWEQQIADLEQQLAQVGDSALPAEGAPQPPAGGPQPPADGPAISTDGGAVILGNVTIQGGSFVGRDRVDRSEGDDQ